MPGALNPQDQLTLALADSSVVQAALARLNAPVFQSWLPATHPHQHGHIPRDAAAFLTLSHTEIIESVSIRGPLHCVDGWGYLARAIGAAIAGDAHTARHLAYYAELRAALSILASEGIGIFNGRNVVVKANGTIAELQRTNTHEMCWLVLAEWASSPRSFGRMVSAIRIGEVPIEDALLAFFASPSGVTLGTQLVHEWGFDLSNGADDRQERNLSSYSPNSLTPLATPAVDDVAFLRDLWAAFEPSRWQVEKHMLRKMLDLQQSVTGQIAEKDRAIGFAKLDPRLQSSLSQAFLFRQADPNDSSLLVQAASTQRPATALSMMSRAALLLRVATSMTDQAFRSAGIRPFDHLASWWGPFGQERGLWTTSNEPEDMAELWYEVEDALTEIVNSRTGSRYDLLRTLPLTADRLHEAERIALWNICR